jgi:hypothetical protein
MLPLGAEKILHPRKQPAIEHAIASAGPAASFKSQFHSLIRKRRRKSADLCLFLFSSNHLPSAYTFVSVRAAGLNSTPPDQSSQTLARQTFNEFQSNSVLSFAAGVGVN